MKKIVITQESLENFKKFVDENCSYPGEIEQEFEGCYGIGNAPKNPTDENYKDLYEFYKMSGIVF